MQNQADEAEYEEFLEDFSDSTLTNAEVQEILDFARQTSNIKLRRLAKEVQHWRSFLPVLLEVVKNSSEKDNQIVKLADNWIQKNK